MTEVKEIKGKIVSWGIVDGGVVDKGKLREKTSNKKRPTELNGSTYSIKTNLLENKLYITINDIEIDEGFGKYKPFELFINSRDKSMLIELEILAKMLSAIFRRTSDPSFIIKELKISSSDQNGYFRPPRDGEKGGKYIPSVYFEIAEVLEKHMNKLGVFVLDKDGEPEKQKANTLGLKRCPNCGQDGVKKESGCEDCMFCEYSKCG